MQIFQGSPAPVRLPRTCVYLPTFYVFKASVFSNTWDASAWVSNGIGALDALATNSSWVGHRQVDLVWCEVWGFHGIPVASYNHLGCCKSCGYDWECFAVHRMKAMCQVTAAMSSIWSFWLFTMGGSKKHTLKEP